MNCRNIDKLLTAYLERALTIEEEAQVRSHLDSCPRCRGELEALTATRNRLNRALNIAASKATPPPDAWERLSQRAGLKVGVPTPKRSGLRWMAAPLSVLLLVILIVGVFVGIGGMAQPPPDAPALVGDGDGGAFLFWQDTPDNYGEGILTQHIDAEGNLLWGEGSLLSLDDDVYSGVPLAVSDSDGGIIITWGDEEGIFVQRLAAAGNAIWYDSVLVWAKPAGGWHSLVGMIADGEGGVILLREDSEENLYAQKVSARGSLLWGEGGAYIGKIQYSDQITMVSDGSGGAFLLCPDTSVSWTELYAQRIGADGSLLWGATVSTRVSEKDRPQLISDGAGGIIVAWVDITTDTFDSKIYAQRLDADGQPLWGEDGIMLSGDYDIPQDLCITADGSGGVVIAWRAVCFWSEGGVFAQRLSPEGESLWGDGVSLYAVEAGELGSDIGDIYIIGDGDGNSLVIWKDEEGALYAQKLDAEGQPLWTEGGVKVYGDAPLRSIGYSSVSSDNGGLIIVSRVSWGSSISNTDAVYAQRIDADGNRLWGESGLEVQSKPSSPILPILAAAVVLVTILALYFILRRQRGAGILSVVAPILITTTALAAKMLLFFPFGYSYSWAYILDTPPNFLSVAVIPLAGLAIAAVGVRKKTASRWLLIPVLVFSALVAFIVDAMVFTSFP